MSERVGLFGGSFDPVHLGHQKIVASFLGSGQVDEVWILPTASPPHKAHKKLTDFTIRSKMAEAAFRDWPGVRVSNIEEQLPAPNYTLRTVKHLQAEYPEKTFVLCIGSDSLKQITSWYHYKELLSRCDLLVAKRPEYTASGLPSEANVHFVNHTPVSFSSTEIRDRLARNLPVADLVPPEVLDIIQELGLYDSTV